MVLTWFGFGVKSMSMTATRLFFISSDKITITISRDINKEKTRATNLGTKKE